MSVAARQPRWLRALRDGWTLTLAGKRRKRCKDLLGGIEGRDGFLPIRRYIFSGLASAQSGLSSIRVRGKTIATLASRRVWPFAIGITYTSQTLTKLSLNPRNPHKAQAFEGSRRYGELMMLETEVAAGPHNATSRRALGKRPWLKY